MPEQAPASVPHPYLGRRLPPSGGNLHVVTMFSSGAGSWAAAIRAAETLQPDRHTLLFSDVTMEDEDNYRFRAELVILRDGRDIWQVFKDDRFLGDATGERRCAA